MQVEIGSDPICQVEEQLQPVIPALQDGALRPYRVILRALTEVWQTLRMVKRERSRRKAASEEIRCELATGGSGGIWQTR